MRRILFVVTLVIVGALASCDSESEPIAARDDGSDSSSSLVSSSSLSSCSSLSSSSRSSSSYSSYEPSVYDPKKQTLTDGRDGQVYRTVVVGDQVWMAENLNYDYYYKSGRSFCYGNDSSKCSKYGRLYTAAAALDSARIFSWDVSACNVMDCSWNAEEIRGACPDGWHVPTVAEWNSLMYTAGTMGGIREVLMDKESWLKQGGSDDLDFSMLATGWRTGDDGTFKGEGHLTCFWLSKMKKKSFVRLVYSDTFGFNDVIQVVNEGVIDRTSGGCSVRCLKDGSGVNVPEPEREFAYSSVEDSRDGRVYKTIEIGDQVWMAENLKLDVPAEYDSLTSCPGNDPEKCESIGRLYSWTAAIDSAQVYSDGGKGCGYGRYCIPPAEVLGLCPEGFHLPSRDDVAKLMKSVGGDEIGAANLKSRSGWPYGDLAYDLYGFNSIPVDSTAAYWIADPNSADMIFALYGKGHAYSLWLDFGKTKLYITSNLQNKNYFIRCLKSTMSDGDYSKMYIKDESAYDEDSNTLTDFRDNKIYRTVNVEGRVWMAENLNFIYNWDRAVSHCNFNKYKWNECTEYGRFYSWSAAFDSLGIFSDDAEKYVRGTCPRGWHLPSETEWEELFAAAGGEDGAALNLMNRNYWGNYVGKDSLGFTALPGGYLTSVYGSPTNEKAYFWESTKKVAYIDGVKVGIETRTSESEYPIRCVMDSE